MMPQVEGLCYIAEFLALLLTFIIINIWMNSQARFTQPFMFEVTYGIIIAFALLIEPL